MWIDDEGVAHTVALPDPAVVMADDFRVSLDAIAASDRATVRSILAQAEASVYAQDWSDLAGSDFYVAAAPPADLLQGQVTTPNDVAAAIDRIEPRWRLDALMALDDYLG